MNVALTFEYPDDHLKIETLSAVSRQTFHIFIPHQTRNKASLHGTGPGCFEHILLISSKGLGTSSNNRALKDNRAGFFEFL